MQRSISMACAYKINIDVIIVGADGNIGELYRMASILQPSGSK